MTMLPSSWDVTLLTVVATIGRIGVGVVRVLHEVENFALSISELEFGACRTVLVSVFHANLLELELAHGTCDLLGASPISGVISADVDLIGDGIQRIAVHRGRIGHRHLLAGQFRMSGCILCQIHSEDVVLAIALNRESSVPVIVVPFKSAPVKP